jgi:hypothetical protein
MAELVEFETGISSAFRVIYQDFPDEEALICVVKTCVSCELSLPIAAFPVRVNGASIGGTCHLCRGLKPFGMTRWDYLTMLHSQQGRCKICRSEDPGTKTRFSVDHDHACCPGTSSCGTCVRGLLCSSCNSMLGFAKDQISTLESAINYLSTVTPIDNDTHGTVV